MIDRIEVFLSTPPAPPAPPETVFVGLYDVLMFRLFRFESVCDSTWV
jgi:hypothetical protein